MIFFIRKVIIFDDFMPDSSLFTFLLSVVVKASVKVCDIFMFFIKIFHYDASIFKIY